MHVPANKMEFFVHSSSCNVSYVHPKLDSILKLCQTFLIASEYDCEVSQSNTSNQSMAPQGRNTELKTNSHTES